MSNKPNPVAETAAMLTERAMIITPPCAGSPFRYYVQAARLASDLHRIAPACKRQAEATCSDSTWGDAQALINGEAMSAGYKPTVEVVHAQDAIRRLDKRVAKLSEALAPFALKACSGGDPRGACLWIESTDSARPVPRNGFGEHWYIG